MSPKLGKQKLEDNKNPGLDYEAFILHKSVLKPSRKLGLDCFDSKLWVVHMQRVN